MKPFLQMLSAVLLALFIKDRVDLYMLEHRSEFNFDQVQAYLLDFLNNSESQLETEASTQPDNRELPLKTEQQQVVTQLRTSTDKEKSWRAWYNAVAPEKCLKSELKLDFVACTDIRISARKAFELHWNEKN